MPASNTGVLESFDNRADYVTRLVVDPTNGFVYMGALDSIYRSTDGGTTWIDHGGTGVMYRAAFNHAGNGIAVGEDFLGDGILYHTSNI